MKATTVDTAFILQSDRVSL